MDQEMVKRREELQKELDDALAEGTPAGRERAETLKKMLFAYRQLGTEEARVLRDSYNKKVEIVKEGEDKVTEVTETKLQTRMGVLEDKMRVFSEEIMAKGIQPAFEGIVNVLDMYTQTEIDRLQLLIDSLGKKLEGINNMISLSEERISNIQTGLDEAQGQRREDLLQQYDNERNALAALQMQEAKLEEQRKIAEEEQAKRQKEMEKRQEALNLLNQIATTSNMIAAAAGAVKSAAGQPFPANLIAIGSSIAALTAVFATMKTAFKFEKGGLVGEQKGGLLNGPRHSQGGIMIEAEGGEFIMSREATKRIGVDNLKELNFNRNLKTFDSPLSGATRKLEQPRETRNEVLEAALALASRPVVVDVQDIVNSQERVNRVKVDSRF
jgi:hypothetical protein